MGLFEILRALHGGYKAACQTFPAGTALTVYLSSQVEAEPGS